MLSSTDKDINFMAKHEKKTEIDLSKGYEKNEIQLTGIVITVVFLVLTCVVAFGLMWYLQTKMEEVWVSSDKQNASPMGMKSEERLPPEPRLQAAPGFGVDGPKGRVNLELKDPRSEWWELQKIWNEQAENGQKTVENGKETVVTLPIEAAKERLLEEGVKTIAEADAKKNFDENSGLYSGASAGRVVTEKRR
jgi:hypothetical protein